MVDVNARNPTSIDNRDGCLNRLSDHQQFPEDQQSSVEIDGLLHDLTGFG
jgi:hypothetical protein